MNKKDLEHFIDKKKFAIRGLPLSKKLWRDGYNRALADLLSYFEMYEKNEINESNRTIIHY